LRISAGVRTIRWTRSPEEPALVRVLGRMGGGNRRRRYWQYPVATGVVRPAQRAHRSDSTALIQKPRSREKERHLRVAVIAFLLDSQERRTDGMSWYELLKLLGNGFLGCALRDRAHVLPKGERGARINTTFLVQKTHLQLAGGGGFSVGQNSDWNEQMQAGHDPGAAVGADQRGIDHSWCEYTTDAQRLYIKILYIWH
jgi:hypothetical protein